MGGIIERYRRRADAFDGKVAAVGSDQWSNPSPCDSWTARDVVGHVIDMHAAMLRPLGRSLSPAPTVEEDPVSAFRSARADVEAVLGDARLAATECETPAGAMTAATHIDVVVSEDLVLHGWDLARATGQDGTMDPVDVELIWAGILDLPEDLLERLRTPGAFGPGVEVYGPEIPIPGDAPLQHRLLGMIGRDPRWGEHGHTQHRGTDSTAT